MPTDMYEIWADDEYGHTGLIDTTISVKQAKLLATQCVDHGYINATVYRETLEGTLEVVATYPLLPPQS